MHKIILASHSPRRKELLTQIGVEFECMPSEKEEITTKYVPDKAAEELSYHKAMDIAEKVNGPAIIIGADTIVASGNRILGKPHSKEEACQMLVRLQGDMHHVYTGVAVLVKNDKTITTSTIFSECTKVYLYKMTDKQIRAYVDKNESMDKAGAYAIQGAFAAYINRIEGDYNNVVGLPVGRLFHEMLKRGIDLMETK